MKEYKIGEIFQWEDRTLMCVEGVSSNICGKCSLQGKDYCIKVCCDSFRSDNVTVYFTDKLIFSAEGIKLQIKRKGCNVKVKVLELGEEFESNCNDNFQLYKSTAFTSIYSHYQLGVYKIGDKTSRKFPTEQSAIDWVEALFSLRGE